MAKGNPKLPNCTTNAQMEKFLSLLHDIQLAGEGRRIHELTGCLAACSKFRYRLGPEQMTNMDGFEGSLYNEDQPYFSLQIMVPTGRLDSLMIKIFISLELH